MCRIFVAKISTFPNLKAVACAFAYHIDIRPSIDEASQDPLSLDDEFESWVVVMFDYRSLRGLRWVCRDDGLGGFEYPCLYRLPKVWY